MKILQITLLLLFVSFGSFAQDSEAKNRRISIISKSELLEIEKLILDYDFDSSEYFLNLNKKSLEYAKNDTLVLFSTGSMGYNSREGVGEYDSITYKYSFCYKDIHSECLFSYLDTVILFYNSIIENEISNRYGKEWKEKCKSEIVKTRNDTNIKTGRKVDFRLLIDDVIIDTIYIERIENLKIYIPNEKIVNEIGKREFVSTISFAKGRKLVSQYKNIESENIEETLKNEFKIKSIDEIDRIVIEFSNSYYSLGLYVYPIK
jgi:hypothetical protein